MRLRQTISSLAAVSALTAVAAVAAPVGQASAASVGGFGARPAHFDASVPATRAYFIRSVPRGGSFTNQVIVFNNGSAPLALRVYPVDGLTGATSGVVYGNRQNRLIAAGRWVQAAQSEVTLPAHSQRSVGFDVKLPTDVTPGVHLAGLAVEEADPHSSGGRFSVTEVLRTVVGIEINVPGPTHAAIALHSVALTTPVGSTTAGLMVSLTNAGEQLCKPVLSVKLTGTSGADTITRRLDTILPGDTIPYPVTWPRTLSVGRYGAVVTATGCGQARVLNGRIAVGHTVPAAGTPAASTRAATPASGGTPVWLFLVIGIGGIGLGGVLARGRRRVHPQS
jgi:hypothetical protein